MPTPPTVQELLARFRGATPEMLERVIIPYRLKIIKIVVSQSSDPKFIAKVPGDVWTLFEEGTTGKVVPKEYVDGHAPWREVVKARIMGSGAGVVEGEFYFPGAGRLVAAMKAVKLGDYVEIDAFGVTSKIESALAEASLFTTAKQAGFTVTRMPENVAMHVGTQNYYDFKLEKGGRIYRVELKSLWGTNTTKARLIHTVSKESGTGKNAARSDKQTWKTSSCRFKDQDIFAVSMWLRSGCITDFAYALSISEKVSKHWGLPLVPKYPKHVTQNPPIADPPTDPWNTNIEKICYRFDQYKAGHIPT